jgi:hypothetical protein
VEGLGRDGLRRARHLEATLGQRLGRGEPPLLALPEALLPALAGGASGDGALGDAVAGGGSSGTINSLPARPACTNRPVL